MRGTKSARSPIGFVGVVQRDPRVAGIGPARLGSGEAWGRHRPQEMPLPAHYTLESAGTLPRVEGQKMAKRTTNLIPVRRRYPSSDA
jgi:hypothetical protein